MCDLYSNYNAFLFQGELAHLPFDALDTHNQLRSTLTPGGSALQHGSHMSNRQFFDQGSGGVLEENLAQSSVMQLDKRHACKLCGKLFYSESGLRHHVKKHTGAGLLPCTMCDLKFQCHTTLDSHMNKHKGIRPHACRSCDKTFYSRSGLSRHEKSHTGMGMLECTICDQKYHDNGALDAHMNRHRGIKPYVCDLCGRAFGGKAKMVRHRKQAH